LSYTGNWDGTNRFKQSEFKLITSTSAGNLSYVYYFSIIE